MTPTEPRGGEGRDLEALKASLAKEIAVAAEQSDATPMERFVSEALCSDDAKAKGLVDRVWVVSLPDARKAIAAIEAWNRRPPVVHGWPDREAVARLAVGGLVGERDRMHGGGYYVCRPDDMTRHEGIWCSEDEAYDVLATLRADAILALFPPVGWRMVPVEPTKAMTEAAHKSRNDGFTGMRALWQAMLAFAPLTDGEGNDHSTE